MHTVLSGELPFLSFREFVQLMLRPGTSGTARLFGAGQTVELLFDNGRFLGARTDPSETWQADSDSISGILSDVLSWENARFELDAGAVTPPPSLQPLALLDLIAKAESLQLDLVRRASDPATLFRRVAAAVAASAGRRPVTLTSAALQLLVAMDGDISAADAGARAALSPSDLQSAIVELQNRGLIQCTINGRFQSTAPMERIAEVAAPPRPEDPPSPKPAGPPPRIVATAPFVVPPVEPARPVPAKPAEAEDDEEEITAAALTLHDDARTLYPLFDDSYTLGRDPSSAIVIPHASISSRHAVLTRSPRGYTVEDLGSRNGTYINGEQIKNRLLHDGDELRVGKVLITYSVASEMKRQKTTLSNVPIPK